MPEPNGIQQNLAIMVLGHHGFPVTMFSFTGTVRKPLKTVYQIPAFCIHTIWLFLTVCCVWCTVAYGKQVEECCYRMF